MTTTMVEDLLGQEGEEALEIDPRTPEEIEKEEAEKINRQQNYKLLSDFQETERFKELCKQFTARGEEMQKKMIGMIKARKNTIAEKSLLDKDLALVDYFEDIIKTLSDNGAEKLLKEIVTKKRDNLQSRIYNQVEEGYDMPLYTEVDVLKGKKNNYFCFNQTVKIYTDQFDDVKEETPDTNPY